MPIPNRRRLSAGGHSAAHDGYSHHAEDAKAVLDTLPNIVQMWPETKEEIPSLVQQMITNQEPTFISLKR
jgi:transketolase C-terminal domain/subunit